MRATPTRAGPGPATIEEVAARAGVSIKTVSRVMNLERYVAAATRERVEAAMGALGYTPNIAARALAGQRSYLVALFGRALETSYGASLQAGVRRACRAAGYHLIVEEFEGDEAPAVRLAAFLSAVRVDGVVASPPECDDPAVLGVLRERGVAFSRVSPAVVEGGGGAVAMDDSAAAEAMTKHLLSLGHRRVAYIRGHDVLASAAARLRGYHAAMGSAGLAPEVVRGGFDFRAGFGATDRLLQGDAPPTAVFAFNDEVALGALAAANRAGVATPAQLSVAGFDDSPAARAVWPQLTTVRQPTLELAAAATAMLFDGRWRQGPTQHLDYALVIRGSTSTPSS